MFIRNSKLETAANNIDSVLTFLEEFAVSDLQQMCVDEDVDEFVEHVQNTIDSMTHDLMIA